MQVEQRAAVIERFRDGKEKVLVTTNVCARGNDVQMFVIWVLSVYIWKHFFSPYFCSYVSTIYMWVYKVSCKKICLRCKVWFKKLSQPECKLLEISFNEFGSPLRITIGHQDTILASTHSDPLYQREAINGFLKELQIYFFCPRYYKKGLGLVSAHNILKLFSYLFQFSAVFLNSTLYGLTCNLEEALIHRQRLSYTVCKRWK